MPALRPDLQLLSEIAMHTRTLLALAGLVAGSLLLTARVRVWGVKAERKK
ncbi:MAG: hypothetical protein L0191_02130 [Acidobacteria bacterium]|nr:hypothetical protein [Acidobacteriota bacterium]